MICSTTQQDIPHTHNSSTTHRIVFIYQTKKKMAEITLLQKAFELYKMENSSMPFKAWATLFLRKTQRVQQKILREYGLA